jgi:hypothetical protein
MYADGSGVLGSAQLSQRMSTDKMLRLDSLKRRKPSNATHTLVDCLQVSCLASGCSPHCSFAWPPALLLAYLGQLS